MAQNMQEYNELAKEVLQMSSNQILLNFKFLSTAINKIDYMDYEESITTDGNYIYYNPIYVLKKYKISRDYITRQVLHQVLHCVFQHFFIESIVDQEIWDLSCDIAVENIIYELDDNFLVLDNDLQKKKEIEELKKDIKSFTAEKIYRYLSKNVSVDRLVFLSRIFRDDDHLMWYEPRLGNRSKEDTANEWVQVSEKLETDLETFAKKQGEKSLSLVQNLKSINQDEYNYEEFLRKFALIDEQLMVNDEEFDYIFYTYGLERYKDIPLIEPLEYKQVKLISDFVIAIDTSASCSGDKVQAFLEKTFNILKTEESFSHKMRIHIIQCDTQIQNDYIVTSKEDIDKYFETVNITGLGGTDFRPVFEYVNDLKLKGEFKNLRGLIYFTDGYGEFPKLQPEYKTTFVFLEDEYNNLNVPSWAIKLTLTSEYLEKNNFREVVYKV